MATLVEQRDTLTKQVESLTTELRELGERYDKKVEALKKANAELNGKRQAVTDLKQQRDREIKLRDEARKDRDDMRQQLNSTQTENINLNQMIADLRERARLALEAVELGLHLYHPELYEGQRMSGSGPVEQPRARLQLRIFDILNRGENVY